MNRRDFFKRMAGAAAAVSGGGAAGFLLGKYGRPDGLAIDHRELLVRTCGGPWQSVPMDMYHVEMTEGWPQLGQPSETVLVEFVGDAWKVHSS